MWVNFILNIDLFECSLFIIHTTTTTASYQTREEGCQVGKGLGRNLETLETLIIITDHLECHENSPKYPFTEHPEEIKCSSCFVGRNE